MADSEAAASRGAARSPAIHPGPPAPTWAAARLEPPLVRPLRPVVARRVGAAAIGLGLLFQVLFVGQLAGVNVPIVVAAILSVAACLAPRPLRMRRSDAWLPVAALAVAGLVAVRSAPALLALVGAIGVNVADPGAFIADQNLRRAADPAAVPPGGATGLDAEYLAGLGPDAIPVLVEALPTLSPRDRVKVESALLVQRAQLEDRIGSTGWPSWNRSRERAQAALASLARP